MQPFINEFKLANYKCMHKQISSGFVEVVCKMVANTEIKNKRNINGESVGDIHVYNGSKLKGVNIDQSDIPNIIDEIPIISILALYADGKTSS